MSKKTFIFDLDGVIVDTAKYHFLAWQRLAAQIGIEFTPEHNEQLKGVSRIKSLDLILALGNIEATQTQKNEWLLQKNTEYLSYIEEMDESEILPGVMPVLDYLKQHKHNIVLGSASKNAKLILQKSKIIDYFDAIVDGNDVSNAKPDPEVFLQGANKVKDTPCNSIVFEDAVAGIQAANLAKMISIGIGDKEVLHEADYIFNDFTFIDITFIENLINEKCV